MIRNGMGPDVRQAIREKLALKLRASVVTFMNDCHDEAGRFCETHGGIHGTGRGELEYDDGFGVSRQPKNRSRLGKLAEGSGVPGVEPEELAEIRKGRHSYVRGKNPPFEVFEGEEGPLRRQVNISKSEVWVSREEFLKLRDPKTGRSALERYGDRDLHGLIVQGAGGLYLDPFASSHAVVRLHQTGMPKLINRVVKKVTGETALSVEKKPGKVSGSRAPREKNRIYMIAGEKGGKKVALNVVVYPNGEVKTAFIEFANGKYADPIQVRKTLTGAGVKIPNKLVKVQDF